MNITLNSNQTQQRHHSEEYTTYEGEIGVVTTVIVSSIRRNLSNFPSTHMASSKYWNNLGIEGKTIYIMNSWT